MVSSDGTSPNGSGGVCIRSSGWKPRDRHASNTRCRPGWGRLASLGKEAPRGLEFTTRRVSEGPTLTGKSVFSYPTSRYTKD
ncbi:hypothetical protein RB916 [Rhodopirellula baltica SH 1]|uniref:Uncharacterized protein n=1 Tax=Rhodopirellula baltica (strain DSM 10527 / NCIMB 13988 / SH1) TaxID=243090 RepID=Q7UY33_RHOBA|nr:hypothetical protein RB916 [Rhodopirellula baltica SH 1]